MEEDLDRKTVRKELARVGVNIVSIYDLVNTRCCWETMWKAEYPRSSSMSVKWCCSAFQGHYANAGDRTFGVLVDKDSLNHATFILQHRALEPGDELPVSIQIPVSVISEVYISFCPWCGCALARHYKRWIEELRRSNIKNDV